MATLMSVSRQNATSALVIGARLLLTTQRLRARGEGLWAAARAEARVPALGQSYPFPTTTSLDQVTADPAVDAVIPLPPARISTWPNAALRPASTCWCNSGDTAGGATGS